MLRARLLAVAALTAIAGALVPAGAASAADGVSVAAGHDVSYPQCGSRLPARGEIAVVGVNAGTGTTTNPCLAEQLAWGDRPAADGAPRLADVYVNTANPGHLGGWWPRGDTSRTGLPVPNPYGSCNAAEDAACAYVYGWSIAADDLHRGVTLADRRTWWLDVETTNSWSWDRGTNLAVLEGMTDRLRRAGVRVGIYSTVRQWALIAGGTRPSSTLTGLPAWVAGATTRAGAEANCAAAPPTPGGSVVMTQWVEGDLDHDVACSPGVVGTTPVVHGDAVVGGRLYADLGSWGPAGTTVRLQWLRDGRPIPGTDGPSFGLGPLDAGARLAVRVIGSRAGQPDLALTSLSRTVAVAPVAPVAVPPLPAAPTPGSPLPAAPTPESPEPDAPLPPS